MRIGIRSLDGNGNDVTRNLGIEWEMGMLIREFEEMGTWNPFPHASTLEVLTIFLSQIHGLNVFVYLL